MGHIDVVRHDPQASHAVCDHLLPRLGVHLLCRWTPHASEHSTAKGAEKFALTDERIVLPTVPELCHHVYEFARALVTIGMGWISVKAEIQRRDPTIGQTRFCWDRRRMRLVRQTWSG